MASVAFTFKYGLVGEQGTIWSWVWVVGLFAFCGAYGFNYYQVQYGNKPYFVEYVFTPFNKEPVSNPDERNTSGALIDAAILASAWLSILSFCVLLWSVRITIFGPKYLIENVIDAAVAKNKATQDYKK
jgi:hypothetical protein